MTNTHANDWKIRAERTVSETVLDVSHAIAYLDENAADSADSQKLYMRLRVARNLAYQFARHNGWGGRIKVTTRDVRAALIAHGASPFTVQQHARAIAGMIRADFNDGRQS